jgi:hypothetical protein
MRSNNDERPEDHSMLYMHPSDLSKTDWCGRHDYYRMTGHTPERKNPGANPSFRMSNIWAEGTAIHGKWQTWFHEMGVLVGMFKCRECGHLWYDKSPVKCQFCQSERVSYREYPMHREQMRVEGHADGAVHFTDFRSLVEIKSIGIRTLAFDAPRLYQRYLDGTKPEDIWDQITHPFASHMRQGQFYLWMAWPVYEQIIFIYESKFHQQVKEFVVDYNKSFIAPILEGVREVSQGFRAGIAPERPDWATGPDGKVCASCVYRSTCWGVDGDGIQESGDGQIIRIQRAKPAARKRALRST